MNYRMPPPASSVNGFPFNAQDHARRPAYTRGGRLTAPPDADPSALHPAADLVLPWCCCAWRGGRRQPAYLRHLGERLALPDARTGGGRVMRCRWARPAPPSWRALLAEWPEHSVLLTHMTPTGRDTSKSLFRDEPRVLRAYLPYDPAAWPTPSCATSARSSGW